MALTNRYVANESAGSADGTTPGNAWSYAQMWANAVAGNRNILIEDIEQTTERDDFTNDGTETAPILVVSAIDINGTLPGPGDVVRTNGGFGPLDTTNMRTITYTTGGVDFTKDFIFFSDLKITSQSNAGSHGTITGASGANYSALTRCVVENTDTGTNAHAFYNTSNSKAVVGCDVIINSTSANCIRTDSAKMQIVGCWIDGSGSTNDLILCAGAFNGVVAGCLIFDAGDKAIRFNTDSMVAIVGNTFYDVDGPCVWLDSDLNDLNTIAGNVAYTVDHFIECNSAGSALPMTVFGNCVGDVGTSLLENCGDVPTLAHTTLTANPFVNAVNRDFRLNGLAGGGALVRAARRNQGLLRMPGAIDHVAAARLVNGGLVA